MPAYFGNYVKGASVFIPFNASAGDGSSITLATNGTLKAYLNGGTTEVTAGLTLVEDHDAITGRHGVTVDTSNAGYTVGSEIAVVLDGAVVDGKTVNAWLGTFSLQRPTTDAVVIGAAQAGAAATVTLPATASTVDDYYNGAVVTIVAGTGAGQSRRIFDYVGSTDVAHVDPVWRTNPDTTSILVVTAVPPNSSL